VGGQPCEREQEENSKIKGSVVINVLGEYVIVCCIFIWKCRDKLAVSPHGWEMLNQEERWAK